MTNVLIAFPEAYEAVLAEMRRLRADGRQGAMMLPGDYALDPVRFAREALGFEPDAKQALVLNPTIHRGLLNCCGSGGSPR